MYVQYCTYIVVHGDWVYNEWAWWTRWTMVDCGDGGGWVCCGSGVSVMSPIWWLRVNRYCVSVKDHTDHLGM